jgi:enoyl-CoA hydratase
MADIVRAYQLPIGRGIDGMTGGEGVIQRREDRVLIVVIDRPEVRNAVDRPTADRLEDAFRAFDADPTLDVAVLTGAGGTFCAGADLGALAEGGQRMNRIEPGPHAPMGPTRLRLEKPVIAAVEGYAVGGGLELAIWCDLRVAATDAVFGVFSRRWGVPLVDGGTVRLPRLVGLSVAMDMILTGRAVVASEAFDIGLVNRLCDPGTAEEQALALASEIVRLPQATLRSDRASTYESVGRPLEDGLAGEHEHGARVIASGQATDGARRFADGSGRHGSFDDLEG